MTGRQDDQDVRKLRGPNQVVVRFGMMKTADLQVGAATAFEESGRYSLSFWTLPDHLPIALALKVAITIGRTGGVFRASTVGRMEAVGFTLVDHRPNGHCSLVLEGIPPEEQCEILRRAFDDPIANPYRR